MWLVVQSVLVEWRALWVELLLGAVRWLLADLDLVNLEFDNHRANRDRTNDLHARFNCHDDNSPTATASGNSRRSRTTRWHDVYRESKLGVDVSRSIRSANWHE